MKQRRIPRTELAGIRRQFARMLDDGLSAQSIMVALKLSRTTYFEWKKKYQEHGLDGLKVRPLPGAAPKLTDHQSSQLRGWLVGRDPRQFQFDFALWTRRIVRDLIRQQFDVEMTPQGVGLLLRRLGLSPQRPLYRSYQQNRRRSGGGRRNSSRRSGNRPVRRVPRSTSVTSRGCGPTTTPAPPGPRWGRRRSWR